MIHTFLCRNPCFLFIFYILYYFPTASVYKHKVLICRVTEHRCQRCSAVKSRRVTAEFCAVQLDKMEIILKWKWKKCKILINSNLTFRSVCLQRARLHQQASGSRWTFTRTCSSHLGDKSFTADLCAFLPARGTWTHTGVSDSLLHLCLPSVSHQAGAGRAVLFFFELSNKWRSCGGAVAAPPDQNKRHRGLVRA